MVHTQHTCIVHGMTQVHMYLTQLSIIHIDIVLYDKWDIMKSLFYNGSPHGRESVTVKQKPNSYLLVHFQWVQASVQLIKP